TSRRASPTPLPSGRRRQAPRAGGEPLRGNAFRTGTWSVSPCVVAEPVLANLDRHLCGLRLRRVAPSEPAIPGRHIRQICAVWHEAHPPHTGATNGRSAGAILGILSPGSQAEVGQFHTRPVVTCVVDEQALRDGAV